MHAQPDARRRRAGGRPPVRCGPATVAASRLGECARWGDERLADVAGLSRLTLLAGRVVAAADAVAMPLFAATRAMPVPDGGEGAQAAVLIHLLRELRAGAMLVAARACGLTPVETIVAGPEGDKEALAFGWPPPFPPRARLMRRFTYADALADRIAGQAYATLPPTDRATLVTTLTALSRRDRGAINMS